uniref:Uncharacterized protein n=1 Tax=Oryza meridionalis TaxID=40149 RepID=A0A0E0EXG5_9ORYZ
MPSMMVQSAGMKRLLRDIESRRTPPDHLAPITGRVAKKFSRPSSPFLAGAGADEPIIKKGTPVSVRTRVGKIGAGLNLHLVLRLGAVVVSDADEDDGFLDVVYNVGFPPDDPFRPVRVARDQVKVIMPSTSGASSTVTNAAAPPPPQRPTKSKGNGGGPRPTVAGKSLRLLTREAGEGDSWSNHSLVLRP